MEKLTLVYTNGKPFTISARSIDIREFNNKKEFTIVKNVRRQKRGGVFIKDAAVSTITIQKSDLMGYRLRTNEGLELVECMVPQKTGVFREILRTNEAVMIKKPKKIQDRAKKRKSMNRPLRVFNVINTMRHELKVVATSDKQARNIARRKNHILKVDTGRVVDVTDHFEYLDTKKLKLGVLEESMLQAG